MKKIFGVTSVAARKRNKDTRWQEATKKKKRNYKEI